MLFSNTIQTVRTIVAAVATAVAFSAMPAVAQDANKPAPAAPERKMLTPGDPAPAIKVEKWIKGTPLAAFEKGKVYVIDFWATDCQTCKNTIQHLTDLSKKHQGKLTVAGISIWEYATDGAGKATSPIPQIEKFVADMGDKMSYAVAYGGESGEMERTWMAAANKHGVPTAFIIDGEGRVAWMGQPMAMDDVLDQVIAGKFDPKAEADRLKKTQENERKLKELVAKYKSAAQAGRAKETLDLAREMLRFDPQAVRGLPGNAFRTVMVNMKQPDLAYEFGKEFLDGAATKEKMWADLNTIAWTIVDDPAVKKRDLDLALKMSLKSVEYSQGKDAALLDTLARIYWEQGDSAKAVETQQKAVAAAEQDAAARPEDRRQIADSLDKYKKGKK